VFLTSKETEKQKHENVEVHGFHVHGVWPKKYLIQLGKEKSALLNRAGSQLRAVPYPV
jgi:ribonuclease I